MKYIFFYFFIFAKVALLKGIKKVRLTFDDVHPDAAGVGVAGLAGVDPGVRGHGALYHESARRLGSLLRNQAYSAPRRVEIDFLSTR